MRIIKTKKNFAERLNLFVLYHGNMVPFRSTLKHYLSEFDDIAREIIGLDMQDYETSDVPLLISELKDWLEAVRTSLDEFEKNL